jgi:hypothetical protein
LPEFSDVQAFSCANLTSYFDDPSVTVSYACARSWHDAHQFTAAQHCYCGG